MALQRAGEVSHHHDGTLQHAHEQHVLAGVVFVDASRQLGDLRIDLFLGEEYVLDIVLHVDSLHDNSFVYLDATAPPGGRRPLAGGHPAPDNVDGVRFKYGLKRRRGAPHHADSVC